MVGLKIIFIKRIYAKITSSGDVRFPPAEIDLKGTGDHIYEEHLFLDLEKNVRGRDNRYYG